MPRPRLILEHPSIFPNFYSVPRHLDRGHLMELHDFLMYGIEQFRWLMVALDGAAASWRCSIAGGRGAPRSAAGSGGRRIPRECCIPRRFLEFVASEYPAGEDAESLAVTTLLEYETQFERPYQRGDPLRRPPRQRLKARPSGGPGSRAARRNRRDPPAPQRGTMRA